MVEFYCKVGGLSEVSPHSFRFNGHQKTCTSVTVFYFHEFFPINMTLVCMLLDMYILYMYVSYQIFVMPGLLSIISLFSL
jgi:hypothetical protein